MRETIYSPTQKFRDTISIKRMFADLKEASFLGKQLFIRDTKGMFRQSFLGILWAFIPPFFNAGIWVFLNATGAVKVESAGIPYPIFVLCGTILFQTFIESLTLPYQTVDAGKGMMAKLNFPREAFLITTFYKLLFNFFLKLVAFLVITFFLDINISQYILLFPVGVLVIILFGMSIGIFLIPFQMLVQDFSRIISLGGQVLMYLTPVVYPMPKAGLLKIIATINPLTELISIPRNWLCSVPNGSYYLYFITIGCSVLLLFFGWIVYRITMPIIVERIGA
jgi:lipopolysaccharide transport system permease protein